MIRNILADARKGGFAVGAFNVNTYDEMVAIADASQKYNLPVIMMASMSSARFFGVEVFPKLVKALNEAYDIPILSHLDHCTDPELLMECANAKFDSVMYDGSPLPYEENVAITADLAKKCHDLGVLIEGELGVLAGEEGPVKSAVSMFTDPDMAEDFCKQTNIDWLAISIGNAHGFYKGKPEIQFEILENISKLCPIPLVLHGGTGIPQSDIQRAIGMGIAKVNVGTEIRAKYVKAILDYADQHREDADVRKFVLHLRDYIGAAAEKYITALNLK